MNRILIVLLIVVSLALVACTGKSDDENANSSLSQIFGNIEASGGSSSVVTSTEVDYESILIDAVGADYLEGKAIMRADDEEVFGADCAVFKIGTNTDEQFVTETWLAVSKDLHTNVYEYDVAGDIWSEFIADLPLTVELMQNCIYALNEVYIERFSAEYYDREDMVKKAFYESEQAFNDGEGPFMLIGLNDAVPEGYFHDPAEVTYFPVYNFSKKSEIYEHFNLYFTEGYLAGLQDSFDRNFYELDGELYLTRGSMGYGAYSIDLDSIDYSNIQNNTLIVNTLYFGEPDGKIGVKFAQENGTVKIDNDSFILMYDLYNVNRDWEFIEVPDLEAFVTENLLPTDSALIVADETSVDSYSIKYPEDYYSYLPDYIALLELLGFEIIMDGYEGFYSLEKYSDNYLLTVNAYLINADDEDGVVLEIIKQEAVG